MKHLLLTVATCLGLFVATSISKANVNPSYSAKNTIEDYLKTTVEGSATFNKQLYSKNFEYSIQQEDRETKYDRKSYLDFLKSNRLLNYDCESSYTLLESNTKYSIAKVSMKFASFERVDYITLKLEDGDWKISKIATVYP